MHSGDAAAPLPGERGEVDDAARPTLLHVSTGHAAAEVGAPQIRREHVVPFLRVDVEERRRLARLWAPQDEDESSQSCPIQRRASPLLQPLQQGRVDLARIGVAEVVDLAIDDVGAGG